MRLLPCPRSLQPQSNHYFTDPHSYLNLTFLGPPASTYPESFHTRDFTILCTVFQHAALTFSSFFLPQQVIKTRTLTALLKAFPHSLSIIVILSWAGTSSRRLVNKALPDPNCSVDASPFCKALGGSLFGTLIPGESESRAFVWRFNSSLTASDDGFCKAFNNLWYAELSDECFTASLGGGSDLASLGGSVSFALEFDFPTEGCFFGDAFCRGPLENLKTHQSNCYICKRIADSYVIKWWRLLFVIFTQPLSAENY